MSIEDLTEPFPNEVLPWLDRGHDPSTQPDSLANRWHRDGYVILEHFTVSSFIERYCEAWRRDNDDRPMGWPYNTPYRNVPELEDLCCGIGLATALEYLIGEPMGVHLNLSGWRSTTRNWHQDGYLNPDHVADWYAAVWIALDDIHPDSGPFEFVPGSHRLWPPIRQDRMLAMLDPDEARSPAWPTHSERVLTPLFEAEIADRGLAPVKWLAKKGDVLIWHARLLHRGSVPNVPGMERRSLIAHYSGVNHRPDMPAALRSDAGGWFFPINEGPHR